MKKEIMFNNSKLSILLYSYLQCFLLLALYVFLFFFKIDLLLIITFIFSLLIGFKAVKNKTGYLLTNNSVIILLLFIFLYGIFNSIIDLFLFGYITKTIYFATLIYASALPSYVLGSLLIKPTQYNITYFNTIENKKYDRFYVYFLLLMLVLLLIYKSITFYKEGLLFNPSVLKNVSRLELFKEINQLWVVTGLMITSISLFFIYYYNILPIKIRLIFICCLVYYITLQLSVGNRRDFIPMIIGAFWIYTNFKKIKFTYNWFFFILIGIFLFLFMGSLRGEMNLAENLNYSELMLDTLSNNEFIYPFFTLSFAVEAYFQGLLSFFYGKTIFLNSILIFIPRVMFDGKPNSLANQFVIDNFGGGMGYAYSPVAEAFVNFGLLGPAIVFFLLGLLVSGMQEFRDQRFIFIFFTMVPDFCRGEFSTFIYQFFFVALFIIIIPMFKKELFKN
jgi:oligosaccharide repeat unit polymerase